MSFGRLERSTTPPPMSEINMTPLIDVMLVLLVIFMITAPLMAASSLKLDLPTSDAAQPSEAPRLIALSVNAAGQWYVGEDAVDAAGLRERVAAVARIDPRAEVQLRADRAVPYGRVAEVIGEVQKAGLTRIALVAEPGR